MKVMVLVKASADSEAGVMPTEALLTAMSAYNQQLVDAGVLQAGEGLHPSGRGVRVRFDGEARTLTQGPFPHEGGVLVSGFWLWTVGSLEEAVDWLKRAPFDGGAEVELRQVFAPEDFGEALTPELRAREERQRAETEARF